MKSNFLLDMWNDSKRVVSMLIDYFEGNYTEIPTDTLGAIVVMCAYVISPIDLVPDIIPIVGFVDDFVVVRFVLLFAKKDLERYSIWKAEYKNAKYSYE